MSFEDIVKAVHAEIEEIKRARIEDPEWLERYNELKAEQSARMRELQRKRFPVKKPNP